jgi:hypothetical protein
LIFHLPGSVAADDAPLQQTKKEKTQIELHMNKTTKAILAGAAIAGFVSGPVIIRAGAATQTSSTSISAAGVSISAQADKETHSCKGANGCKGQGGCKSSDNGCKGKNSCKGKGGCATDGSATH